MSKACRKCGVRKRVTSFYKHAQMSDGRLNVCKPCFIAQTNAAEKHRFADPVYRATKAAGQRAWRAANPRKARAAKRRYMKKHRVHALTLRRARRIERTYKISRAEYAARIEACNNRCEICRGKPGGRWNRLFVDHDHKNGKVRGMLCINCNLAIGYIFDSPALARAIGDYLTHGGKAL